MELLFLWRGSKKNCIKFQLGTELEDAEKFDDIVFFYYLNGKIFVRYLQAKYSRFHGTVMQYSDCVDDWNKARCNLKKCFISYRKIKQRKDVKRIYDLILCTNISVPAEMKKNSSNILTFLDVSNNLKDDIFYDSKTKKEWKKYQLQNISTCPELEKKLKACSNLNLLAIELAEYLFKDLNDPKLDLKNYWLSAYFNALLEENVISYGVYRFSSGSSNPKTPQQIQRNKDIDKLKIQYIAEMKNQKDETLLLEEIANVKFEKEFIDKLILRNGGSTDFKKIAEIMVQSDCTKAVPMFENLNNVLAFQKEHVFCDAFINGINMNENAKNFRKLLFDNCEILITKSLEKHEFYAKNAFTSLKPYNPPYGKLTMKKVANKLVHHIFYKKDISDVFESKCGFLENVFELTRSDTLKFTKEFVNDTNSTDFRRIFMDLYVKEKLKIQVIKFKQKFSKVPQLVQKFKAAYLLALKNEVIEDLKNRELFFNDAAAVLNKESAKNSSTSNKNMEEAAKELIDHIFDKQELNNVFLQSCNILGNIFEITGNDTVKFSKCFVENNDPNLQEFYNLFFELYTQKLLHSQTFIDKITENNATNVIKFDKTKFKELDGLMEALNGSVFIASEKRNKLRIRATFFTPNQNFPNKLTHEFKDLLKKQITDAEFEILKNFEIEYFNYPPYFDKLEENGNINDEIEEFRKLFFIVKTPNEMQLMEDVSIELGEKFNLLDSDMISHEFFHKILNWAKESEEILLTKNNATEIINNLKVTISEKLETGCTVEYCQKLEEYGIEYMNPLKELEKFLYSQKVKILHLTTDQMLLTAIKAAQTMKSINLYTQMDSYIFNPLTSLLRMENALENGKRQNHVSNTFGSTSNLIIIVEKETQNDIDLFCDKLKQILCNNSKKKIVIIGSKNSRLASTLRNFLESSQLKIIQDTTKFNDLTEASQSLIRRKTKIIFQGNSVSLNNLLSNNKSTAELINSETLQKMILEEKIIIGEPIKSFDENQKRYYHPRKFRLIEINPEVLKENALISNHIFAIEGTNVLGYLNTKNVYQNEIHDANDFNATSKPGQYIILDESKAKEDYEKLCKYCPEYFIHWLKLVENKLVWFYSYIPISKILPPEFTRYIIRESNYVDESFFYEYVKQNQVVIICDIAGMGKTTVLNSFSQTLHEKNIWKIRINLNQYTSTLMEIKKHTEKHKIIIDNTSKLYLNFDPEKKDCETLILKSLINYQKPDVTKLTFENKMFNHFFENKKMLFIFDGYDEINPDYGNEVTLLLQKLKTNEKNRIWITSRTHYKYMLEKCFNTFAYDLKPFDEKDQEIFLTKFWLNNWKIGKRNDMPNQDRLFVYIKQLLNEASTTIGNIIGIPLQTKMLAEIFQEKYDDNDNTWISCFEYVELAEVPKLINISTKIKNVFLLYEKFFEEKVYKYFLQAKGIVNLEKPYAKKFKRNIFAAEFYVHQIFGYLALIGQNFDEKLLTQNEKDTTFEWLQDFYEGVENIGVIQSFNSNSHPLFTHFTYAEYFAASFLVDKLVISPFHARNVFEIANEIFKKDVKVFMECFLYRLKQETGNGQLDDALNGKTALKFAVEHGFIYCITVFLNSEDFNDDFPYTDESETNILQYAAQSGSFETIISIISYILYLHCDSNITSFAHLYSYIFTSYDYNLITGNNNICLLIEDIKQAANKFVKTKTIKDAWDLTYDQYQNHRLKIFNVQKVMKNIEKLFPHLSFQSIINILKIFKPQINNTLDFSNLDEICLRNDINKTQKLHIFKLIIEDDENIHFNDAGKILRIIVKNDCRELLKEIFNDENFEVSNIIIESLFTTALEQNLLEIVKILMEKLKPNDSSNTVELICQALKNDSNVDIIKFLIEKTKVSLNTKTKNGETVLLTAIKYKCNLKKIKCLMENGADPNTKNEKNESPWTLAVEKADDKVIKYFLDNCENLDGSKNMTDTLEEYFDETKLFDVNRKKKEQIRLHCAITDRDNILCHFLLKKGSNVHLSDANGNSLLYLAWKNKMFDVVRLLLFYGATFNENDNDEKFLSDEQIQKYTNEEKQTLWHIKAKCMNVQKRMYSIEQSMFYFLQLINKSTINQKDINGNTALHLAVHNNNAEFTLNLLNHGASYNIINNNGKTPIDLIKENEEIIKSFDFIIKCFEAAKQNNFDFFHDEDYNNSSVKITDVQNEDGKTLLHYAVLEQNIKLIKLMIEMDANITAEDHEKRTPLYYAVKDKSHEVVKCLLNSNTYMADSGKTYKDINESTILISRIQQCMDHVFNEEIEEIIEVLKLIQCNEEFNIVVKTGTHLKKSVACLAAKNYKLAKYLLENGVIIQSLDLFPSFMSLNSKIEKAINLLKEITDILKSKEFDPDSIIKYCENSVKPSLCNLLFIEDESVADKIITNVRFKIDKTKNHTLDYDNIFIMYSYWFNGGTLLHLAAAVNQKKIVKWLIKKGADPNAKDHDGNNVYDVAKKNDSNDVLEILQPMQQRFRSV
uniref:NACHT domain-containing protein n=1 Tax=Panagrolaimus sp. ES5 TaxID=591445 RepID=A0AC34F3Y5_9BILA